MHILRGSRALRGFSVARRLMFFFLFRRGKHTLWELVVLYILLQLRAQELGRSEAEVLHCKDLIATDGAAIFLSSNPAAEPIEQPSLLQRATDRNTGSSS